MARTRTVAYLSALLVLTACTATISGHGTGNVTPRSSASTPAGTFPVPGGSATLPRLPAQQPVSFLDCSSALNLDVLSFPSGRKKRLSFGCATVAVPLDYADPGGKTINIQMIKIHDRANTTHTGSLLVNPGGPGGSGVELAIGLSAQVSDALLSHFDLIGFDPRGVGLSAPIRCISNAEKDRLDAASPNVLTAAGFAEAKANSASVAQQCTAIYGAALANFDTVQTAEDMDRVRQAVGDAKMNYLGFSYGTELGSVYAHLFPDEIRVAVLDGAVDPLTANIKSFHDQLRGFEGAFDQFAANCVKTTPCSQLANPRQAVYQLVAHADATPIPSSRIGETRTATSATVLTAVLSALYSQAQWPALGKALLDARTGDSAGLFALADQYNQRNADGSYTNITDANLTIGCNDSKPGPSDPTIRATASRWKQEFPMFGLEASASLFACQQWQPDRTIPPLPVAATPHKVLVIGNLHDPATPYQGAKDLASTMGNAVLLTWDGEGHTSYLQGSTCVDHYVDKYLINVTLPPDNTTCPR